jgi:hypothetical protein
MKKSSWIALSVVILLLGGLIGLYTVSNKPTPGFNQEHIVSILDTLKSAVNHKDVRTIVSYLDESPETRVSRLNSNQTRLFLSRAFQQSGHLNAEYKNLQLHPSEMDPIAEFDLEIKHSLPEADGTDYNGHIILHMKQVEIPHMLGLYHTKDWRIARAEVSGTDLANYGDY